MHEIKTKNLLLRPVRETDTEQIYRYAGDPSIDMMMFLPKDSMADTALFAKEAARQWEMDEPEDREYVILLDGCIIGGANLERCPEEAAFEIGWVIAPKYRNHGYATEAANALISYAFTSLQARRVRAHCDSRNSASQAVMKKVGMELLDSAGTRYYPKTGITSGEYLYAIDQQEMHCKKEW